eukprot:266462-Pyramimonas_sp.AAC.1
MDRAREQLLLFSIGDGGATRCIHVYIGAAQGLQYSATSACVRARSFKARRRLRAAWSQARSGQAQCSVPR